MRMENKGWKIRGDSIGRIGLLALITLTTTGCTLSGWLGKDPAQLELTDVSKFINHAIDFLGAFGGLVTIFVMVAGYQMLMGAGNEESQTRAKDTLKYAALGMVLLVFGYAIVKFVFTWLVTPGGPNPFQ